MKHQHHADCRPGAALVRRALALVVAVATLGAVMPATVYTAFANDVTDASTATRTTDPLTLDGWRTSDGAPLDQDAVGAVWTDKSVATDAVTVSSAGNDVTVAAPADDEFLVGLSAASSEQTTTGVGAASVPLDITLVLDSSGSMLNELTPRYVPDYNVWEQVAGFGRPTFAIKNPDPTSVFEYQELGEVFGPHINVIGFSYRDPTTKKFVDVSPMTSPDDPDPTHVQFYRRDENYYTRERGLREVAKHFIDQVEARNEQLDDARHHRVAVVSYSDEAKVKQTYTDNMDDARYWVDSYVDVYGGTDAQAGLVATDQLVETAKRPGARSVVLFLTDGEPRDVNAAIAAAHDVKMAGSTVYSIGIFADADRADMTAASNRYMQAVSSNYPDATALDDLGTRAPGSDFYMPVTDLDSLYAAFDAPLTSYTVESGDPTDAVTFTDRLGDGMAVRDVRGAVLAGTLAAPASSTTVDGVTTVAFGGELEGLSLAVTRSTGTAGDTVTVEIPARLLPLTHYDVRTDADGNTTVVRTVADPIRVFYTVGLRDGVLGASDDGARFLAHAYGADVTAGTTARFVPAAANAFYRNVDGTARMDFAGLMVPKADNATGTADHAALHVWDGDAMVVSLGNNGALAVVGAADDPSAPEESAVPSDPADGAPNPAVPSTSASDGSAPSSQVPSGAVTTTVAPVSSVAQTGAGIAAALALAVALACAAAVLLASRRCS